MFAVTADRPERTNKRCAFRIIWCVSEKAAASRRRRSAIPSLFFRLAMTATMLVSPMQGLGAREKSGRPFTLGFRLHQGFILIPGSVDGQRGYFMLDSGSQSEFLLNREGLTLPSGVQVSAGSAASGQAVTIFRHPGARNIQLASRRYERIDQSSGNFGFVAKGLHISLLGFVGIGYFGSQTMTIDYRRHRLTIAPGTAKTIGRPITTLQFDLRHDSPEIRLTAGDVSLDARIDIGSQGEVMLTEATRAHLRASGLLREVPGHSSVNFRQLCYGTMCFSLTDVPLEKGDADRITLGSNFFERYKSIWRYSRHSIELLPP